MKSLVLVPLFLVSILHCLAQSSGGDFTKRIEFNVINCLYEKSADGDSMKLTYKYNLSGKSVNEKFLFGDMNAEVEFFTEPSFSSPYGLRIIRDSLNFSHLEIREVANYGEVEKRLGEKYSNKYLVFGPDELDKFKDFKLSDEEKEAMAAHNREMGAKREEERWELYRKEVHSVPVTDAFAQLLFERVSFAIDTFKGVSSRKIVNGMILENVILDGDTRIFRCVVDDEVWMLKVHEPTGRTKALATICDNIFNDVKEHTFREEKYLEELKQLAN